MWPVDRCPLSVVHPSVDPYEISARPSAGGRGAGAGHGRLYAQQLSLFLSGGAAHHRTDRTHPAQTGAKGGNGLSGDAHRTCLQERTGKGLTVTAFNHKKLPSAAESGKQAQTIAGTSLPAFFLRCESHTLLTSARVMHRPARKSMQSKCCLCAVCKVH